MKFYLIAMLYVAVIDLTFDHLYVSTIFILQFF